MMVIILRYLTNPEPLSSGNGIQVRPVCGAVSSFLSISVGWARAVRGRQLKVRCLKSLSFDVLKHVYSPMNVQELT